jgi:O-antigen/teichoic acid export membrane protein
MNDVNKRLFSHGGIYLVGNILQRAVSFVMLPIYTRYLAPADYGILELLTLVIDIVSIILGLRISQAIFRFYHSYEDKSQRYQVITTSMILIGGFNLLGVLIIVAFSTPLSVLVFDHPGSVHLLIIFSFTLFFHALIEVPMVFMRARQKPLLFVAFSTYKLLLQLSLNIYFVVWLRMKVEGVIYSAVITGIVMSITLLVYTLRITGLGFSLSKAKQLTSFSWPLVLTGLISFFITFGDRYFLRFYGDLADVGIYSLAYKFGFLLMFLIVQPFSNHWDSEKYVILNRPNAREIYQKTFLAYSTLVIFFVVLVSVFIEDLLRIMSDPSFWPAARIAPIIMLAYLFNAWATYTTLGIFTANRTIEMTYGTIIGAIVVGIAYMTLIPGFGAMGAAWASVLGFGSRFVWITWRSQKLYYIPLSGAKVLAITAAGGIAYILSLFGPQRLIPSILFDSVIVLGFLALLLYLPILPENWRHGMQRIVVKPWKIADMFRDVKLT